MVFTRPVTRSGYTPGTYNRERRAATTQPKKSTTPMGGTQRIGMEGVIGSSPKAVRQGAQQLAQQQQSTGGGKGGKGGGKKNLAEFRPGMYSRQLSITSQGTNPTPTPTQKLNNQPKPTPNNNKQPPKPNPTPTHTD